MHFQHIISIMKEKMVKRLVRFKSHTTQGRSEREGPVAPPIEMLSHFTKN